MQFWYIFIKELDASFVSQNYIFVVVLVNIFYSEMKCPQVRSNATSAWVLDFPEIMQSLNISDSNHVLQFSYKNDKNNFDKLPTLGN